MAYRLGAFADVGLDEALLRVAISEHEAEVLPRLRRLWMYYRNPSEPKATGAAGWPAGRRDACPTRYRLAQECGLPARITGDSDLSRDDRAAWRREAVVENDIGWRVQLMVDFMFGKPVLITSTAADEQRRRVIERVLDAVWESSGGIALLQDMALLGHVYGHVDLLVRMVGGVASAGRAEGGGLGAGMRGGRGELAPPTGPDPSPHSPASGAPGAAALQRLAEAASEMLKIEVVEPTRGRGRTGGWRCADFVRVGPDADLPRAVRCGAAVCGRADRS